MGSKRTWALLRSLIQPSSPKDPLSKILLATDTNPEILEQELIRALYPDSTPTPTSNLTPRQFDVTPLDSPFTLGELMSALASFRRSTTPGEDAVTYKLLKNLPKTAHTKLLEIFNVIWDTGQIPAKWKHSNIILIPKPGKPLTPQNLRPISLTSCTGKLLERMVLTRLEWHLETNNILPPTLTGFRHHISTQDTHLRLHHDILEQPSSAQLRCILALDIRKAFDCVNHEIILTNLAKTNCGTNIYNYIRDFLSNRSATFHIPGHKSTPFYPTRGTPQGSILSPTLFNLAMLNLPQQLNEIPDLFHSVYADDVTLWTNTGSPGEQEGALQAGCDRVSNYAASLGLTLAPDKSELLVVSNRRGAVPERGLINPTINGQPVPHKPTIKVLGLAIQQNGRAHGTLAKLHTRIQQITHLISRI